MDKDKGKEKERDIERDRDRDTKENKGRFKKGNTIGYETRFQKGNKYVFDSKYEEEYADMLIEYFETPQSEIIYEEIYNKDGSIKRKIPKMILPPKFPTLEMFATSIGVTRRTLAEWISLDENGIPKHPRFAQAYAYAREKQFAIAKENAISKQYDSNFSKFILINDFGMKDKQEVDTNVNGKIETPMDERTLALIERVEKRMNGDNSK